MKRIFYFAAMALAACAVMVSCEKEETTTKTNRLATPQVTATVGETEVSVSWEAIENAVSYEYTVDDGTAENVTATSFTIPVADLATGSHTVSVKAIPEEGAEYKESRPGTATFKIKGAPVQPEGELSEWLGSYEVTASRQVELTSDGQYVSMAMVEEPTTFNITIDASEDPNLVYVYGFSKVDATIPAIATLFSDQQTGQVVGLGLLAEEYPVAKLEDGTQLAYYGIYENTDQEGVVGIVGGLKYTFIFVNNGTTITSEAAPVYFSETQENPYYVVATDVMSAQGQEMGLYYQSYPVKLPAGVFTLTKTGNAAPVNAFSRDIQTLDASAFTSIARVSIVR